MIIIKIIEKTLGLYFSMVKKKMEHKIRIVTVTVASKRMIAIPAKFAKKYNIKKSTKVEIIDTGKSLLLIPIISYDDLFGVDSEETTKRIVNEIYISKREEVEPE